MREFSNGIASTYSRLLITHPSNERKEEWEKFEMDWNNYFFNLSKLELYTKQEANDETLRLAKVLKEVTESEQMLMQKN